MPWAVLHRLPIITWNRHSASWRHQAAVMPLSSAVIEFRSKPCCMKGDDLSACWAVMWSYGMNPRNGFRNFPERLLWCERSGVNHASAFGLARCVKIL